MKKDDIINDEHLETNEDFDDDTSVSDVHSREVADISKNHSPLIELEEENSHLKSFGGENQGINLTTS